LNISFLIISLDLLIINLFFVIELGTERERSTASAEGNEGSDDRYNSNSSETCSSNFADEGVEATLAWLSGVILDDVEEWCLAEASAVIVLLDVFKAIESSSFDESLGLLHFRIGVGGGQIFFIALLEVLHWCWAGRCRLEAEFDHRSLVSFADIIVSFVALVGESSSIGSECGIIFAQCPISLEGRVAWAVTRTKSLVDGVSVHICEG